MTKTLYVLSSIILVINLVILIFISLPSAKSVFVPNEQIIPEPEHKNVIDITCQNNEDCLIKNVGNLCGYYPICVNKNFLPTPPEFNSIICGFPSIDSCRCLENKCQGFLDEN